MNFAELIRAETWRKKLEAGGFRVIEEPADLAAMRGRDPRQRPRE